MRSSLIILFTATALSAQEAGAPPENFTPPKAYPVTRYEAGWSKNPFTLKTAPAVVASVSFAKDLAIAGISGDTGNPTVTIVNTKTHERFRLKLGQPGDNGMVLRDVKRAATRKDSFAEVVLGGETSKLTYDNSYLTQVASTSAARGAPAPGAPNAPNLRLPIQPNARALPAPAPRPPQTQQAPKTAIGGRAPQPQSVASGGVPQGIVNPGAFAVGASPTNSDLQPSISISPAPSGSNSFGTNLSVSVGAPTATSAPAATTPSQEVVSAVPVPVRRRIITPITPPSNN